MKLPWIVVTSLFLFIWITVPVFGQQKSSISGKSLTELKQEDKDPVLSISHKIISFPPLFQVMPSGHEHPARLNDLLRKEQSAPRIYSYDELGLFCKFEVQMERVVKFPVKFRLGDVQYVDWLEGKREF